ncbi:3760_t:CDS:2 [Ambispora gerdemannii]|uniref:3760_t:CDS:1 n=1 Tax=Ambispora gerdemannii TaxID=144530 RepID=A0A9N9CB45_9GLOM|nr:3760_t:CDS:2 [Ambispora gerdemannii]
MAGKKRKILLLVDNATSHIMPENSSEVQDNDTDESSSENDSIDEIEELQEEL